MLFLGRRKYLLTELLPLFSGSLLIVVKMLGWKWILCFGPLCHCCGLVPMATWSQTLGVTSDRCSSWKLANQRNRRKSLNQRVAVVVATQWSAWWSVKKTRNAWDSKLTKDGLLMASASCPMELTATHILSSIFTNLKHPWWPKQSGPFTGKALWSLRAIGKSPSWTSDLLKHLERSVTISDTCILLRVETDAVSTTWKTGITHVENTTNPAKEVDVTLT